MRMLSLLALAILVVAASPADAEPTCQELPGGQACAEAGPEAGDVVVDASAEGVTVHAEAHYRIG